MDGIRRRVPVLNSLVFVLDSKQSVVPNVDGIGAYWKTDSCVAVSCLPDCDGETEIVLARGGTPPKDLKFLVAVRLDTPSRRLAIELVPHRRIAELDVPYPSTRLDIWTDGYGDTAIIYAIVR